MVHALQTPGSAGQQAGISLGRCATCSLTHHANFMLLRKQIGLAQQARVVREIRCSDQADAQRIGVTSRPLKCT